jgi:hypothetical protein
MIQPEPDRAVSAYLENPLDLEGAAGPDELYRRQVITICLILRVDDRDPAGREVLLGIRNGTDCPLFAVCRESELGTLPPVLTRLVETLKQTLPARETRRNSASVPNASTTRGKAEPAGEKVSPTSSPALEPPDSGRNEGGQQLSLFDL